jgi:uncharacterized membrane protein YcaP (DUF421 family)
MYIHTGILEFEGGSPKMDWFDIIWRTVLAVVILFLMTKLLGKRQVSQLSLFEYITGITIGSIAAYVSLDAETEWYLGLISLSVWVAFSYGIEYLQLKSKKMRDFIDNKGTVLIQGGKILQENLKKERLTTDELMEQLRKKAAFKVADVEFAIMEPSGDINILLTKENQPLTPKDLGLAPAPEREPQTVIMDGKLMEDALRKSGYNLNWLNKELQQLGVEFSEVFLAQVDSAGELYTDLYNDRRNLPRSSGRSGILVQLKKCEGDLAMCGLASDNEKLQNAYSNAARKLDALIGELHSALKP